MDKNKIIQAATKYVQKGQFDKAIKEYQKIIDDDPKDIRILQKVGELHQKRGDNVQAALTFIKVAESYSNDGFFLKAAAVYKQVLKLNPNLVETNFKLAELYQQLGLMSDALQQFQLVAAAYEQQGDVQASLGILKKLTDLDPENVANRIRLAESYSREGMNDESVAEFTKVAAILKQNNRADEYIKVAERLAFLDPQNMTLCRELANVYLAKGDTKRALAKLQICFKTDPRDVETLTLLAQAFKDLGQTTKTVSVYKELAKIFSEADRFDDEQNVWRKILVLAPDDQDALVWQSANGSVTAASVPPEASRVRASPTSGRNREMGPEAVPKLLTEMDVYLKYGLHAKAAEHLKKILSIVPDNLVAHEKAKDLYLTMGDTRRAADELAIAARLALEAGERDRAQEHLVKLEEIDPEHPDLSSLAGSIGADVEVAELADDAILVEASEDEILVAADEEVVEEVPSEEFLVDQADVVADEALYGDESPVRTNAGFEASSIEGDEALVDAEEGGGEALSLVTSESVEAFGEPLEEELGMTQVDTTSEGDVDSMESAALPFDTDPGADVIEEETAAVAPMADVNMADEDEFENVATQAYDRDALLAEAFGKPPSALGHPVRARSTERRPVIAPPPPAPVRPKSQPAPVAPARPPSVIIPPPAAAFEPEDPEELAEADFFIEQQLWDEAEEVIANLRSRIQHHPHLHERLVSLERRLAAARDEGEATEARVPPAAEADDQFDLAAELEKEVASEPVADSTDDFQYSVEDVLREFKKGVERTVRPEDVETHYDLGIAYREMGLLDEAIGEFDMAAKGASGKPREADCLAMIGECLSGKGSLVDAAAIFEKASQIQGLRPETTLNLSFEIGVAREGSGDAVRALAAYEKVSALDPKYRDVAERLARLKGARRKVGYL